MVISEIKKACSTSEIVDQVELIKGVQAPGKIKITFAFEWWTPLDGDQKPIGYECLSDHIMDIIDEVFDSIFCELRLNEQEEVFATLKLDCANSKKLFSGIQTDEWSQKSSLISIYNLKSYQEDIKEGLKFKIGLWQTSKSTASPAPLVLLREQNSRSLSLKEKADPTGCLLNTVKTATQVLKHVDIVKIEEESMARLGSTSFQYMSRGTSSVSDEKIKGRRVSGAPYNHRDGSPCYTYDCPKSLMDRIR